jgi:hypothetical protein
MDEDGKRTEGHAVGKDAPSGRDQREATLAAALRANLRRRKAAGPKPDRKADR